MYVEGIYLDVNSNIWFNVSDGCKRETVSREEAIKRNFMEVIRFYEKNIRLYPS